MIKGNVMDTFTILFDNGEKIFLSGSQPHWRFDARS
jgi:hypothetical protein